MIKNKISGRLLKVFAAAAIIILFVIFAKENAYAASFSHVHTDSCYESVTKTCNHYIQDTIGYPTLHCFNCGQMQPFIEIVYWDVCPNGIKKRVDAAYNQYCQVCFTNRRNERTTPARRRPPARRKEELQPCRKSNRDSAARTRNGGSCWWRTNPSTRRS